MVQFSSVTEFLSLPWDLSLLFSFVLGHMFVLLFHKVALPVQVRNNLFLSYFESTEHRSIGLLGTGI